MSRRHGFAAGPRYLDRRASSRYVVTSSPGKTAFAVLRNLADGFGVDVATIRRAIANAPDGASEIDTVRRIGRVRAGLEKHLGGAEYLKMWSNLKVAALDDRRPADVLAEGRIAVLERIEKALEWGVFS